MSKDYAYCSGVTCPIRKTDPPDTPLYWIPPAYKEKIKQCPHYEPINNQSK